MHRLRPRSALAVSFLLSASSGADSEKTERSWTARVLEWPGGRFLVAGFGVVVIGVGHNGLTCACYLARAGLEVLELADRIDGAAHIVETIAAAPGYRFGTCVVFRYRDDRITLGSSGIIPLPTASWHAPCI